MNKKRFVSLLSVAGLAVCFFYFLNETAEAARFGRSRSFGSRPTYQRSAPAPSSPSSTQTTQSQKTQQNPGATALTPRGRWGGMLGGLLMGGLIGSMLFGGGFAGPGFLDILLLGGGLFLLMRFLRSRRATAQSSFSSVALPFQSGSTQTWGNAGYKPSAQTVDAPGQPAPLPADFDAEEFLKGARMIYTRLQSSWDKRDLEDIRAFTSKEVFAEIQSQAQEDPRPGKTELLLIEPRIIEARDLSQQRVVSVLYDVMMREDGDETAKQVRELWHFSKDVNQPNAFWLLEGIQQVEV